MSNSKNIMQGLRVYSSYVMWVVGVLVIFANLWIASKLTPINQNLAVMAEQIEDMQDDVSDLQNTSVSQKLWETKIGDLNTRLSRIENKIDQLK